MVKAKPSKHAREHITPMRRQFVREWLIDFNGRAAAVRAGYSAKSAKGIAVELLAIPELQELIAEGMKKRIQRTEVTQDAVIEEFRRLGFSNILDYICTDSHGRAVVDEDGTVALDLKNVTREAAAAISELVLESGKDGRPRIKLYDKRGPLVDLGKHLGLFPVSSRIDVGVAGAATASEGEADGRTVNITVAFE